MSERDRFDFDRIIERRGTASVKWDEDPGPDLLPLWVADQDFAAPPEVIAALRRRVEHGVFGYSLVPEEFRSALIDWQRRRHGWRVDPSWLLSCVNVVAALSASIMALTRPGDRVLVQTPVYNCFFSSIANNGRGLEESPLRLTPEGYRADFEDLARRLARPEVSLFILCNPHNPGGRVWRRDELERLARLCAERGVTVVSDEIHADFVFPGHRFQPFEPLARAWGVPTVTLTSASKTFNLAGLQLASLIVPDDELRRRLDRAININEVCEVNCFAPWAAAAAYRHGEPWLTALLAYLTENDRLLRALLAERLPKCPVVPSEGTYLAWLDCSALGLPSQRLADELRRTEKLWLNPGTLYGAAGEGFLRLNMACPRSVLREALERLIRGARRLAPAR